jgi:hypothetical protein
MRTKRVANHVLLVILVLLGTAAGCRRSQLAGGLSDSTYVAVMADLKRMHDAPGMDSAQRAARRDSILRSRGLTPAQLEAAARQLADNPGRAQTVWQAIERRSADTTQAK